MAQSVLTFLSFTCATNSDLWKDANNCLRPTTLKAGSGSMYSPLRVLQSKEELDLSLNHFPNKKVPFEIEANLGINASGTGNCFYLEYTFEGQDDKLTAKTTFPYGQTDGNPQKTTGYDVKSCQNIQITPKMFYRSCNLWSVTHYTHCPWPSDKISKLDQSMCYYQFSVHVFNPVLEWLKQKKMNSQKSYPMNFGEKRLLISWGNAKKFSCQNTRTKASFKVQIYNKIDNKFYKKKEYDSRSNWTIFEDITLLHKITQNVISCNNWYLETILKITFWKDQIEEVTFTKIIQATKPLGKVLMTDVNNKTDTIIIFEDGLQGNTKCLTEHKVKVLDKMDGTIHDIDLEISRNEKKEIINVSKFLNKYCQDGHIYVFIDNTKHDNVNDFRSKPILKYPPKINNNEVFLEAKQEQFKNCTNMIYEIKCKNKTDDEFPTADLKDPYITTFNETGNPHIQIPNLHEKLCKARSYINFPLEDWSKDFSDEPLPDKEKFLPIKIIIIPVLISISILFTIALAVFIFGTKKEKQAMKRKNSRKVSKIKKSKANRVAHCIIEKNEDLLDNLTAVIGIQYEVNQEYENILKHNDMHISKTETTHTAHEDTNMKRNRYSDMVPYDSNMVILSAATGTPLSTYINASHIKFPGCSQEFLAVQAPRPNMFSPFWQMVDDKNVNVIVMITGLQEGNKVKAHQYWPDKDNIVEETDNGFRIQYISHAFPGTYYHRILRMMNNKGKERDIEMLQCTAWQDMTAPDDTKILLDLLYKSMELVQTKPGPILVHCSAGIGRTGTFIGLYKLVNDFKNDAVKEIDFFETVVTMREQRMMMVQKPMQYYYMIRCLTDYVSANESIYE